ncbi:esterase-like activity of phytase family protein [Commensalibacter sp. TBRC 16381]|uniref:Esterase-like activity of phytase family protein n=1 Tax=Commensalibacter oyaizuii TaxID=3043873 RepID=A0ABT6PY96_9PROT|nr:esterase-like activity of phytase family protein [Commensalibacter sp. TBRC 16381]MDI2089835.1 esterase-like activity of phytase family protein [Commensalibacter sp. TBRC 16381]
MRLSYINQVDLPADFTYDGYKIGGLSGIDYDPVTDTYIAQSDIGADGKPAAVYTFKFTGLYDSKSNPGIQFEKTPIDLSGINDVESIRMDPKGDGFWVTTEETVPSIYHYHADGTYTKSEKVPDNIKTASQPSKNLKGSTFTPDGSYFVSLERNLTKDQTGYTRITKFNIDGDVIAQYAYYTDRPSTVGATSNGISEILAIDNDRLLVLERGYNDQQDPLTGQSVTRVRIYEIDLNHAQNVMNISNLTSDNTTLVDKTLVFDSMSPSINGLLNTSENRFDNIEGMALGPKLADGRDTLVLVSDNNYNINQNKTQFVSLAFGTGLHYLNQLDLPFNYTYTDLSSGATYQIGGLSGIDYNPQTDTYLVEVDHQPGMDQSIVYEIKLTGLFDQNGNPNIEILRVVPLFNAQGGKIYDAESIRWDPKGDGFWITTEETVPSIYHYHTDGSVSKIAVPDNIVTGVQSNLALKGQHSPQMDPIMSLWNEI